MLGVISDGGPATAHASVFTILIIVGVLLLSACAAQSKVDAIATENGLDRSIIDTGLYRHLIYSRGLTTSHQSDSSHKVLHVYLEGDGSPWLRPNIVALDPTGRTPLALKLMALDKSPSVYVGRPCYHGFYQDKNCSPLLWTHARYAEPVIAGMSRVLQQLLQKHEAEQLYLIGYSGGGVLAMLLAERVPQIKKVITIAANLDIDAWVKLHGYSPLQTSLNPAKRLQLYKNLAQHHFAGRLDENIPLRIIQQFVSSQESDQVKISIYDKFDHRCCWLKVWPGLVSSIEN